MERVFSAPQHVLASKLVEHIDLKTKLTLKYNAAQLGLPYVLNVQSTPPPIDESDDEADMVSEAGTPSEHSEPGDA